MVGKAWLDRNGHSWVCRAGRRWTDSWVERGKMESGRKEVGEPSRADLRWRCHSRRVSVPLAKPVHVPGYSKVTKQFSGYHCLSRGVPPLLSGSWPWDWMWGGKSCGKAGFGALSREGRWAAGHRGRKVLLRALNRREHQICLPIVQPKPVKSLRSVCVKLDENN